MTTDPRLERASTALDVAAQALVDLRRDEDFRDHARRVAQMRDMQARISNQRRVIKALTRDLALAKGARVGHVDTKDYVPISVHNRAMRDNAATAEAWQAVADRLLAGDPDMRRACEIVAARFTMQINAGQEPEL